MQSVHTDYYFKKHFLEISQLYAKKNPNINVKSGWGKTASNGPN